MSLFFQVMGKVVMDGTWWSFKILGCCLGNLLLLMSCVICLTVSCPKPFWVGQKGLVYISFINFYVIYKAVAIYIAQQTGFLASVAQSPPGQVWLFFSPPFKPGPYKIRDDSTVLINHQL